MDDFAVVSRRGCAGSRRLTIAFPALRVRNGLLAQYRVAPRAYALSMPPSNHTVSSTPTVEVPTQALRNPSGPHLGATGQR